MRRHVGRYIRECRDEAGLSLRELAAKVGVSDVFLSQVERGRKRLDEKWWGALTAALPTLDLEKVRTRDELDDTMPLDLESGADAGRALELARRMTTTPLTDEMTNSLIAILERRN